MFHCLLYRYIISGAGSSSYNYYYSPCVIITCGTITTNGSNVCGVCVCVCVCVLKAFYGVGSYCVCVRLYTCAFPVHTSISLPVTMVIIGLPSLGVSGSKDRH